MKDHGNPPRSAVKLLLRILSPHLHESVVGDLEEERRSLNAGAAWFWLQSLGIVWRYVWSGLRHRRPHQISSKGDGIMETIWIDLRYAARMLIKAPAQPMMDGNNGVKQN